LIGAGLAAFGEEGLDAPSLDAICARAGLTRGAFYVHFRNREDFLVAVMDQVIGAFLDAIIATGDEARDVEHTVRRFADAAEAVQAGDPRDPKVSEFPPFTLGLAFHRLLDACARSEVVRRRFVELVEEGTSRVAQAIRRGQAAGSLRADLVPDAMANLLSLVALGVITALETRVPLDAPSLRDLVHTLMLPPGPSR